jgi:hypothetical protein
MGVPGQPFRVPVTVIVPTIDVEPVLVAVKDGTEPLPLAARPMEVLLLVQLKVAPAGVLVKACKGTVFPGQTELLVTGVTTGVG